MERDFKCKKEEVPAIAGFLVSSFRRDLVQFSDYSPEYNEEFATDMEARRKVCLQMVKSGAITNQMKQVTSTLKDKTKQLRPILNKLEGYLKLANGTMDISADGFGLTSLRTQISDGNVEGIIAQGNSLITDLTRNKTALAAKGLKEVLTESLTSLINEIDTLNNGQNSKLSERIQTTSDNNKEFNELWAKIDSVLSTGRSLYRGVDDVKLKDYTLEQLLKRINAEGGSSAAGGATTVGNN
ncbi:MAG: hypothetical protein Q8909_00495 [Bacteroidota bacterium]|nr:hypothetical protein [Bacteroidota bacterium]